MIFVSYCFALHEFVLVTAHPPPWKSDGPPLGLVSVMGKPFVLFDASTVASQGEFYLGGRTIRSPGRKVGSFFVQYFFTSFWAARFPFFLASGRLA